MRLLTLAGLSRLFQVAWSSSLRSYIFVEHPSGHIKGVSSQMILNPAVPSLSLISLVPHTSLANHTSLFFPGKAEVPFQKESGYRPDTLSDFFSVLVLSKVSSQRPTRGLNFMESKTKSNCSLYFQKRFYLLVLHNEKDPTDHLLLTSGTKYKENMPSPGVTSGPFCL